MVTSLIVSVARLGSCMGIRERALWWRLGVIPPFSSHLTPASHSLQQQDHFQETFSALVDHTNFVFLRSSALSVDGGWDPYSQCHVLGLIPSPPNVSAAFRLTAICRNARHRAHENISATTHSITSGHSTNQTTTGLCSWGRSPTFPTGRSPLMSCSSEL